MVRLWPSPLGLTPCSTFSVMREKWKNSILNRHPCEPSSKSSQCALQGATDETMEEVRVVIPIDVSKDGPEPTTPTRYEGLHAYPLDSISDMSSPRSVYSDESTADDDCICADLESQCGISEHSSHNGGHGMHSAAVSEDGSTEPFGFDEFIGGYAHTPLCTTDEPPTSARYKHWCQAKVPSPRAIGDAITTLARWYEATGRAVGECDDMYPQIHHSAALREYSESECSSDDDCWLESSEASEGMDDILSSALGGFFGDDVVSVSVPTVEKPVEPHPMACEERGTQKPVYYKGRLFPGYAARLSRAALRAAVPHVDELSKEMAADPEIQHVYTLVSEYTTGLPPPLVIPNPNIMPEPGMLMGVPDTSDATSMFPLRIRTSQLWLRSSTQRAAVAQESMSMHAQTTRSNEKKKLWWERPTKLSTDFINAVKHEQFSVHTPRKIT